MKNLKYLTLFHLLNNKVKIIKIDRMEIYSCCLVGFSCDNITFL